MAGATLVRRLPDMVNLLSAVTGVRIFPRPCLSIREHVYFHPIPRYPAIPRCGHSLVDREVIMSLSFCFLAPLALLLAFLAPASGAATAPAQSERTETVIFHFDICNGGEFTVSVPGQTTPRRDP
jgi:hypothetical protein